MKPKLTKQRWLLSQKLQVNYLSGKKTEKDQKLVNFDNRFLDKHFYCWDTDFLERRDCCFLHQIGLPQKDGETKPFFPYELEVYEAWEHYLHIWIKKATGLGISEFFLYLIPWLCVRDNQFQGCQMCIVTGPNIDLAKKLIK